MYSHRAMRIVLIILSSGILTFIWLNSFLPASLSKAISTMVQSIFGIDSTQHAIRKAGHFTEFLFLGLCLFLLANETVRRIKNRVFCLSFLALFIPLMDETIQLFSDGRSAEVRDIWIDVGGYTLGCAAALAGVLLVKCGSSVIRKYKNRGTQGDSI